MPNWCETEYVAIGPREQIIKLFNLMHRLEEMPYPGLVENEFGSSWLGNLVTALCADPFKIGRCRGIWYGLELDLEQDKLTFWTSTAWCEANDTRNLIERCFPGIKFYYMSEESGCGYWVTNDSNSIFFHEKYYVRGLQKESMWFNNLLSLVDFAEEYSNSSGLHTFDDCVKAIRSIPESLNDYLSIQEVTIEI